MPSIGCPFAQRVRMGSAPISLKLWDAVKATFPGALVMNSYGTTEAGPVVCAPRPDRTLPPLSIGRCTQQQVLRMQQHFLRPEMPTDFD